MAQNAELPQLGLDIMAHIILLADRRTRLTMRLVNKAVGELATRNVFRHVHLSASKDGTSFVRIARSTTLRPLVREVTCDTDTSESGYEYHSNEDFAFPQSFYRALPYVRYFADGHLQTLNLRFNEYCESGHRERNGMFDIDIEETPDVRFRILETVFRCLDGTWTAEGQETLDKTLDLRLGDEDEDEDEDEDSENDGTIFQDDNPPDLTDKAFHNLTLTISNLADYDDPRLSKSDLFRSVLGNPERIRGLKLFLTMKQCEEAPETEVFNQDQYERAEAMPRTWLMPSLASHLTVLSLYSRDYWGWAPRLDFRWVNPGPLGSPDAGFPHLRVLALGNYIFSHTWQIDWIASLGQSTGSGLEELYLDDAPILFHARVPGPLDKGTTEHRNPVTGAVVEVSNDLYPTASALVGSNSPHCKNVNVTFPAEMRWHHILDRWRAQMKGLRVFRMGHNSAWSAFTDRTHVWYDAPANKNMCSWNTNIDLDENPMGMDLDRKYQCQYISYNINLGPTPWIEGDDSEEEDASALNPTKASLEKDSEALAKLLEVVQKRNLVAQK